MGGDHRAHSCPRLAALARGKNIDLIFLLAPNSSQNRIKAVSKASTGFIYLMSITGITGVRKRFSASAKKTISKIRKFTDKPIAIGFGISNPAQAKEAAKIGDGVIVGSAIVKEAAKSIKGAARLVKSLKKAIS
ncbi:MAG: tryptophan synthase subunit alpha [Candidatus Margulisiibacteriota bacterium]